MFVFPVDVCKRSTKFRGVFYRERKKFNRCFYNRVLFHSAHKNSTARNYVLLAVAQFPELFGKFNEGLRRHETELFFAVKGQKFFLPHDITCPMEQRDKGRRALNTYKKRSRHGRTHNPFADRRPRVAKLISFHFLLLLGMPNGGVSRKKPIY